LDWFTKDRRGGEEGLYTSIDRIFQLIGANRAHYFGHVFEGVDIRKIMAKSDDLFGFASVNDRSESQNSDSSVYLRLWLCAYIRAEYTTGYMKIIWREDDNLCVTA